MCETTSQCVFEQLRLICDEGLMVLTVFCTLSPKDCNFKRLPHLEVLGGILIVLVENWRCPHRVCRLLNLSNYNKDGSPEDPHFTYSWRRKGNERDKGGVHRIYLNFDYICLSDFLFGHILTPPPPLTPHQKNETQITGNIGSGK